MSFKLKYSWFLFLIIIIITILSLTGKIVFGNGLADVIYVLGIICSLIVSLIANIYFTKKKDNKLLTVILISLTIIIFYYIYSFTVGRGAEYRWNGELFK